MIDGVDAGLPLLLVRYFITIGFKRLPKRRVLRFATGFVDARELFGIGIRFPLKRFFARIENAGVGRILIDAGTGTKTPIFLDGDIGSSSASHSITPVVG